MQQGKDEQTNGCYPKTQWTLVIDAIQRGSTEVASAALEDFCGAYRPAVHNFFRRRGCSHEESEDHTQAFFASKIIEKWEARGGFLHAAQRSGQRRFRSFLSHVLWRFLQDQTRARMSQKEGGSLSHVPLADPDTPGEAADEQAQRQFGRDFDRSFALTIIEKAAGRSKHADFLVAHLRSEVSQKQAAEAMGVTEGAFKKAFFDFRKRLAHDLWVEVSLVAGPKEEDIRAEIEYLMSLFAE